VRLFSIAPFRGVPSTGSEATSPPPIAGAADRAALPATAYRRNEIQGGELKGQRETHSRFVMNGLIYLVGLVVVIMAVLSFVGIR
jgi:hypothetical protein